MADYRVCQACQLWIQFKGSLNINLVVLATLKYNYNLYNTYLDCDNKIYFQPFL